MPIFQAKKSDVVFRMENEREFHDQMLIPANLGKVKQPCREFEGSKLGGKLLLVLHWHSAKLGWIVEESNLPEIQPKS